MSTKADDPSPNGSNTTLSRRELVGTIAGVSVAALALTSGTALAASPTTPSKALSDEMAKAKIRRALLSGPDCITRDATVAEMDLQGKMTVLRRGTNHWVCVPGNENIIGAADMCADPMGMQWMMDAIAGKPKPTNATPGLIYMLNGALQRSFTDPFDKTSPPIPIGPHWMILWPFDAAAAGLSTVMRDAGTLVMFAGTPYAHLHICGSPWEGNEYRPGDKGVWTMKYAR